MPGWCLGVGPSCVTTASTGIQLPAGSYLITGYVTLVNSTNIARNVGCYFVSTTVVSPRAEATVPPAFIGENASAIIPVTGIFTLASSENLSLRCNYLSAAGNVSLSNWRVTATAITRG
jgi:hypothetical protein